MGEVEHTLASAKRLLIVVVLGVAAWGQAQASDGSTPLHAAAAANAFEKAQDLLDDGADVHGKNEDGDMPLHVAAGANAFKTVEVLLNNGANVRARGNNGSTPLHAAAAANAVEVAEVLLNVVSD